MKNVKCLSLLQPWAQMVVTGKKIQETRSWDTEYRGILYIHASKRFTGPVKNLCKIWPFDQYIQFPVDLPRGAIVGCVELWKTGTSEHAVQEMCKSDTERNQEEHAFGDYSKGRYIWYLRSPVLFEDPIPAKGSLRIWNFNLP